MATGNVFTPNSVIEQEKINEARRLYPEVSEGRSRALENLASAIRTKWEQAKRAKITVEDEMIASKRQRSGEYEPEKLAAIKSIFGDDYKPVFMMLTETKCRAAESWIKDILLQPNAEPWDIEPTPKPELPEQLRLFIQEKVFSSAMSSMLQNAMIAGVPLTPEQAAAELEANRPFILEQVDKEMKKAAKEAADKMKEKIKDQLKEGGWDEAFEKVIHDIVTYKAGFLKGPFLRKEVVRSRKLNEETGRLETIPEKRVLPRYERCSPFDIYPSPDSTGINDGYLFHKISLSPKELSDFMDVPGWNTANIKEILERYKGGGLREWTSIDMERKELEQKEASSLYESDKIDCLEYHGSASGRQLAEWGMNLKGLEDERVYEIRAWLIDNLVLKAMLNPDLNGKKNISKASFIEDPDAFWGTGVPETIADIQEILNSISRAVVNNVAIASGPQVEANIDRLSPGTPLSLHPWKIWMSTNSQMQEGKPVNFFMPPLVTDKLTQASETYLKLADEWSGVPRYAHGETNVSGAGGTASGLSMLMTQAARGIKSVIKNIDRGVTITSIERQYNYNLDFGEDEGVIGDLKIVATGSSSLIAKEQQAIRRSEFLAKTANPYDMEILGYEGRAEVLRESAKSLDIDLDKIFEQERLINLEAQRLIRGGAGTPERPVQTDAAGNPAQGRDFSLFNERAMK